MPCHCLCTQSLRGLDSICVPATPKFMNVFMGHLYKDHNPSISYGQDASIVDLASKKFYPDSSISLGGNVILVA